MSAAFPQMDMDSCDSSSNSGHNKSPVIDVNTASLSELLSTCIHYFESAKYHTSKQNTLDLLRISLIGLRLSRWGRANNIHHSPKPEDHDLDEDEVNDVRRTLGELVSLFDVHGSCDNQQLVQSPQTNDKLKPLIEHMDNIIWARNKAKRIPFSPPCSQCQGYTIWTSEEFEKGASLLSKLEKPFGTSGLRDLVAEEQSTIQRTKPDGSLLKIFLTISRELDPWNTWGEYRIQRVPDLAMNYFSGLALATTSGGFIFDSSKHLDH